MLVIDLDETLVHCQSERQDPSDLEINIDDGEVFFLAIRPFALSFLKKMSSRFEIIVYTASERDYADAILDELDPNGYIKHRLYR